MAETVDDIETLQAAIQKAYDRAAKRAGSVPVREVLQGKTVWEGVVEVFDLIRQPLAKRAYAWGHAMRDTGNAVRIVTILGMSPVDSSRRAVQVSIAADAGAKHGDSDKARGSVDLWDIVILAVVFGIAILLALFICRNSVLDWNARP